MDAQDIVIGVNNLLRLRICFILENRALALSQIKDEYEKKYKVKINRETLYRGIEILVKNDIADKIYDKQKKKILYSLLVNKIILNFESGKIKIERK